MKRIYSVIAIPALFAALAVAGCGGGSGSGGEGGYGSSEGGGTTNASSREAGGGGATIAVKDLGGDVGSVLVDSKEFTLYYFEKDKGGKSACYGPCAASWPPLTTEGAPKGMSGVQGSKLATTKRTDGGEQVIYTGWPLYTYIADQQPGEDNGTDVKEFGGTWYPLHPNGEKAGE